MEPHDLGHPLQPWAWRGHVVLSPALHLHDAVSTPPLGCLETWGDGTWPRLWGLRNGVLALLLSCEVRGSDLPASTGEGRHGEAPGSSPVPWSGRASPPPSARPCVRGSGASGGQQGAALSSPILSASPLPPWQWQRRAFQPVSIRPHTEQPRCPSTFLGPCWEQGCRQALHSSASQHFGQEYGQFHYF